MALPTEEITKDIHCVTRWSKLGTDWRGVSLDTLLADVETGADFALAHQLRRVHDQRADRRPARRSGLDRLRVRRRAAGPRARGPARLLVPHLYFWKSAKWVRGLVLSDTEDLGFWETAGYHEYGDPWKEQRYAGD